MYKPTPDPIPAGERVNQFLKEKAARSLIKECETIFDEIQDQESQGREVKDLWDKLERIQAKLVSM